MKELAQSLSMVCNSANLKDSYLGIQAVNAVKEGVLTLCLSRNLIRHCESGWKAEAFLSRPQARHLYVVWFRIALRI